MIPTADSSPMSKDRCVWGGVCGCGCGCVCVCVCVRGVHVHACAGVCVCVGGGLYVYMHKHTDVMNCMEKGPVCVRGVGLRN